MQNKNLLKTIKEYLNTKLDTKKAWMGKGKKKAQNPLRLNSFNTLRFTVTGRCRGRVKGSSPSVTLEAEPTSPSLPHCFCYCFLSHSEIAAQSWKKMAVGFVARYALTWLCLKHFIIGWGHGVISEAAIRGGIKINKVCIVVLYGSHIITNFLHQPVANKQHRHSIVVFFL